jgi:HSP20 family protein
MTVADRDRFYTGFSAIILEVSITIIIRRFIMSTKALSRTNEQRSSIVDDFFKPFNEWFGDGGRELRTITTPSVNVSENDHGYKVTLAVPGLKRGDFNIKVDGNMITISSEKEEKKESKDEMYTRQEYNYSSFSRSFMLPEEVNQEKIDASYTDGILTVSLPKREEAKKTIASKVITVK